MTSNAVLPKTFDLTGFSTAEIARAAAGNTQVFTAGANVRGALVFCSINASGAAVGSLNARASAPTASEEGMLVSTRNDAAVVMPGVMKIDPGLGCWIRQHNTGNVNSCVWFILL